MSKAIKKYSLSSQYSTYITAFVSEKQGLGNKYYAEAGELKRFDRFVVEQGYTDPVITKTIFEIWAKKRVYESEKTHYSRFRTVRQLCQYMTRIGSESYISPMILKFNKRAFKPYVFTDDELERFMKSANNISGGVKNRLLFPMLYEILICTGLRLGEALKLERANISYQGNNIVLFVHGEKFDKDRLVPLTENMSKKLQNYLDKIIMILPDSKHVFPTQRGGAYCQHVPYITFRKILWMAGISHGGRGKGPRIHDFRHTFAVKALRKLVVSNEDMLSALPLLCKYLGHQNIYSTQTYLSLTAEMFPSVTSKMETAFEDIIPKLEVSNE